MTLASCGRACILGAPHSRVTRPVHASEIAGTWRITEASLTALREEGLSRYAVADAHKLDFQSDGSCAAKTVLGGTTLGVAVDQKMPCTWQLVTGDHGAELRLTVVAGDHTSVSDTYRLAEENGRLLLWVYLGDPDTLQTAEFQKYQVAAFTP